MDLNSLRTLVLAENLPYPTLKGGDLRSWQNVNALMDIGQVGVFGLCSNDLRAVAKPRKELSFWRSSSDPALASPLPKNRAVAARAWFLNPTGHPADLYYSTTAAEEIAGLMAEFKPHIVVIERLWLYRYIECIRRSSCRVVLDNHNVESVLYRQIGGSIPGADLRARLMRDAIPARTEAIEKKASQTVDQVWVCSREDARLMRGLFGLSAPIHVVPNGVDVQSYTRAARNSRDRSEPPSGKSILFTATFAYPPNARAALFLIQEVFPRLTDIDPGCRLLLVGNTPTPEMMHAALGDARIVITGAVPDVRPYIASASAMVVPLFQGSGTRFKILEAFASKTPVISTATGAEGLSVKPGIHLLIAGDASEFVAGLQQLWHDESLVGRLTKNAYHLVRQTYSWDVARRKIGKAVHAVCRC